MQNAETEVHPGASRWSSPLYTANAALSLLMFCILLYSCTRTLIDPDLYWHIKVGMDICRTGVVVSNNNFSFFTSNQVWVSHNWLADLIWAYIYSHFGYGALVIFKAFVVALMLAVVYKTVSQWEFDSFGKSLLLLSVAFFASPATNCLRPQVFSCLFMAILFVLLRIAKSGNRNVLWWLPPIFALWVNLHGGFVLALTALLIWILAECFIAWRNSQHQSESQKGRLLFYWLIFALSCSATMVTPYGYEVTLLLLRAVSTTYPGISEWQPIVLQSTLGMLWAAMVLVTLFALVHSKRPQDAGRTLLWFVFAAAPLTAIRHLQFFGIATALLVGEHLASSWHQWRSQNQVKPDRKWAAPDVIFVGISLALAIWLTIGSFAQITTLKIVPGEDVPEGAIALLKRIKAHGNMVVNFDWGGYAIWYLAPDVKVSYDSRFYAYTDAERLANDIFNSGLGPWDTLLQKFKIDMVLVRTTTPTYNLMKLEPGWRLAYEDDVSALFFPIGSSQGTSVDELLHALPKGAKSEELTLPLL